MKGISYHITNASDVNHFFSNGKDETAAPKKRATHQPRPYSSASANDYARFFAGVQKRVSPLRSRRCKMSPKQSRASPRKRRTANFNRFVNT